MAYTYRSLHSLAFYLDADGTRRSIIDSTLVAGKPFLSRLTPLTKEPGAHSNP